MLEHDRIDISVDTEINKTSDSGECKVNHYWYLNAYLLLLLLGKMISEFTFGT